MHNSYSNNLRKMLLRTSYILLPLLLLLSSCHRISFPNAHLNFLGYFHSRSLPDFQVPPQSTQNLAERKIDSKIKIFTSFACPKEVNHLSINMRSLRKKGPEQENNNVYNLPVLFFGHSEQFEFAVLVSTLLEQCP